MKNHFFTCSGFKKITKFLDISNKVEVDDEDDELNELRRKLNIKSYNSDDEIEDNDEFTNFLKMKNLI